jgi:hypothetical protein
VDSDTGELRERRRQNPEEPEPFYRDFVAQGMKVRVGMEASGVSAAESGERLFGRVAYWVGCYVYFV